MLKASAAFGAFNLVPAKVLWGATAPSNQLTRALIGFGAIAHSANHLPFKGSRPVGLCDPFEARVQHGLACAEEQGWARSGPTRTSWSFWETRALTSSTSARRRTGTAA